MNTDTPYSRRQFLAKSALCLAVLNGPCIRVWAQDKNQEEADTLSLQYFTGLQRWDAAKCTDALGRYAKVLIATRNPPTSPTEMAQQVGAVHEAVCGVSTRFLDAKSFNLLCDSLDPVFQEGKDFLKNPQQIVSVAKEGVGIASSVFGKSVIDPRLSLGLSILGSTLDHGLDTIDAVARTAEKMRLATMGGEPLFDLNADLDTIRRVAISRTGKLIDLCQEKGVDVSAFSGQEFQSSADQIGFWPKGQSIMNLAKDSPVLSRLVANGYDRNLDSETTRQKATEFATQEVSQGFSDWWEKHKKESALFRSNDVEEEPRKAPAAETKPPAPPFDKQDFQNVSDGMSILAGIAQLTGHNQVAMDINRVGVSALTVGMAIYGGNSLQFGAASLNMVSSIESIGKPSKDEVMFQLLGAIETTLLAMYQETRISFAKLEARLQVISAQLTLLSDDVRNMRNSLETGIATIQKRQTDDYIYHVAADSSDIRAKINDILRRSREIVLDRENASGSSVNDALRGYVGWGTDLSIHPALMGNGDAKNIRAEIDARRDVASLIALLPKVIRSIMPDLSDDDLGAAANPLHWAGATQGFLELCISQRGDPLKSEAVREWLEQLEKLGQGINQLFTTAVRQEVLQNAANQCKDSADRFQSVVEEACAKVRKDHFNDEKDWWRTGEPPVYHPMDWADVGPGSGGIHSYLGLGQKGYYAAQKFDLAHFSPSGGNWRFYKLSNDPFALCQAMGLLKRDLIDQGEGMKTSPRGTPAAAWDSWQTWTLSLDTTRWQNKQRADSFAKSFDKQITIHAHRINWWKGGYGEAFYLSSVKTIEQRLNTDGLTPEADSGFFLLRKLLEAYRMDCEGRLATYLRDEFNGSAPSPTSAGNRDFAEAYVISCARSSLLGASAWWVKSGSLPLANHVLINTGDHLVLSTDQLCRVFDLCCGNEIPLVWIAKTIKNLQDPQKDIWKKFVNDVRAKDSKVLTTGSVQLPPQMDLSEFYGRLAVATCHDSIDSLLEFAPDSTDNQGLNAVTITLQRLTAYRKIVVEG